MKQAFVMAAAAVAVLAASPAMANLALAQKNACMACHAVDKKLVGPSYQDVAKKYAGKSADELAKSIKAGGSGKWGPIPMPAQAALSEADALAMIRQGKGKDQVLVIEEGQPEFIEQQLTTFLYRAGSTVKLRGKGILPMAGEYTGQVMLDGQKITIRTPGDAVHHGIALVPEDRKRQGIIPDLGVGQNITLAVLDNYSKLTRIDAEAELGSIGREISRLHLKTASPFLPITSLSGGNQQKAVLAKMLMAKPKVLILDEPTRGVDVGAKYEIYKLMGALAAEGVSIIMVSSELAEVLGVSDRVLVIGEGQLRGDFVNNGLTQEQVLAAALSHNNNDRKTA